MASKLQLKSYKLKVLRTEQNMLSIVSRFNSLLSEHREDLGSVNRMIASSRKYLSDLKEEVPRLQCAVEDCFRQHNSGQIDFRELLDHVIENCDDLADLLQEIKVEEKFLANCIALAEEKQKMLDFLTKALEDFAGARVALDRLAGLTDDLDFGKSQLESMDCFYVTVEAQLQILQLTTRL